MAAERPGEAATTVLVIVPTFNEAENLGDTVAGIRRAVPAADILVVDDASPDGTGAVADRLAAADPRITVLHRSGKAGLGAAYLAGFDHAIQAGYDLVVEMDADGSHRADDLPRLLGRAGQADLVIGSRWVPGGSVAGWGWHRRALSIGGNAYTRVLLALPVRDATAGFRVYRGEMLARLDLASVRSVGYVFQVEMTHRVMRAGGRVVEVPITFVERTRGRSKMTAAIAVESLYRITRWGLGERFRPG